MNCKTSGSRIFHFHFQSFEQLYSCDFCMNLYKTNWERGLASKELPEEEVSPWHVSGHAVHVQHREAWLVIIDHVPKRKVFLFWENGEKLKKWHLISRHHSPLSNSVLMALSESDFSGLSHVILQILEWKYWFRYYVCQYIKVEGAKVPMERTSTSKTTHMYHDCTTLC